jgi:hypothetical protein
MKMPLLTGYYSLLSNTLIAISIITGKAGNYFFILDPAGIPANKNYFPLRRNSASFLRQELKLYEIEPLISK